jgi:predicted phage terminase large subunit-like protein
VTQEAETQEIKRKRKEEYLRWLAACAELERRTVERRQALIAADREACKSLSEFIKRAWHVIEPGTVYKHNWHIEAMAAHLEAVYRGEIRRLMINVPPGASKSTIVGVFFAMWCWGPMQSPHLRFVGVAHEQTLGVRDNLKCRRLLQSEWFQERWPVLITSDQNEKLNFENVATGFRSVATPSNITGRRGNVIIIDDPISVENANSVVEREKVNQWFAESLPTRLNDPETSAIVLVMQRVHEDDPTGMILSKGWGWDHLMIPMEYEPERASTTSIQWKDPRTKAGELFFPDRFPAPVVEEYRKTLGAFAYAGQMQQRPAPREGAMFKRSWFKPLKAAPAGCRWVRYWDLAASEVQFGSDPDYTVGLKLGRMQDGRFIIADVTRMRAEGTGVRRMIRETAKEDGRYCEIGLPQDPGQAGKIQAQDLAAMLAGYVVGVERETGDKITRAEPIAAQAEAGNVYYVEGDWNEAFFSEVTLFPGSKHKDQVDALSGAFSKIMRSNMFGVQEEMVAIDPIKIVSLWGRVAAIDVGPTNVSIVFGAWNQTTDTLMVYEAYTAPRGPLPVHVDLIRRLHPAGTTGMWIPVLFSMKDHGRTEEEGAKLAGALANLGPQIITVPLDMEAAVSEMAERLSTRRLRVFGDQPDWFASYRRFTRDEKGEISGDNDGLLRATGLIALWGKDSAVTENRAISDGEGFDRAQYERKRSVTGY